MISLTNQQKTKSRSRRNKNKHNNSKATASPPVSSKPKRSRRKRNKRKSKIHSNAPTLCDKAANKIDKNLTATNNIQFSESKISDIHLQQVTNKPIDERLPAPEIKEIGENFIVMLETPNINDRVTRPFILKWKDDKTQRWIHKLSLHQKKDEKHLKLYSDEDFLAGIFQSSINSKTHCDPKIFPNPKQWGKHPLTDPRHLRIMAVVNSNKWNNLITLRDVRDEHYELLVHIKFTLCQQIEEIYGIKRNELKIYVHYRPTALFVHKYNYKMHTQNFRDYFVDDILENIRNQPNFYRDATLEHQIYFDRPKSIAFAKHTKRLMNMKGIHSWYDRPDNKRSINRSAPVTMEGNKKRKAFSVNKSAPSRMGYHKPKRTGILGRNNFKPPGKIANRFPTSDKPKNGKCKRNPI